MCTKTNKFPPGTNEFLPGRREACRHLSRAARARVRGISKCKCTARRPPVLDILGARNAPALARSRARAGARSLARWLRRARVVVGRPPQPPRSGSPGRRRTWRPALATACQPRAHHTPRNPSRSFSLEVVFSLAGLGPHLAERAAGHADALLQRRRVGAEEGVGRLPRGERMQRREHHVDMCVVRARVPLRPPGRVRARTFSSAMVVGTVAAPRSRMAATSATRAWRAALVGSTDIAKRPLAAVYSTACDSTSARAGACARCEHPGKSAHTRQNTMLA